MAGNLPTKKPALAGTNKNSKYKTNRQYKNLRWTILEEVLDGRCSGCVRGMGSVYLVMKMMLR
jgi:hypothetical protein